MKNRLRVVVVVVGVGVGGVGGIGGVEVGVGVVVVVVVVGVGVVAENDFFWRATRVSRGACSLMRVYGARATYLFIYDFFYFFIFHLFF